MDSYCGPDCHENPGSFHHHHSWGWIVVAILAIALIGWLWHYHRGGRDGNCGGIGPQGGTPCVGT
ncbi:hypothetical protein [Pasteuria penetrans]|uniref:hypothetical protein n=1 Tax=Pasteuria penetrans TaxID=86005 RepID=UPI0011ED8150|nr:hypothetical protein [Pasteuria penetrans]